MMKICSRCNQEKSLEEFHRNRRNPDGLQRWCKECTRIHARAYAQTERRQQYVKEYLPKWREKNPEKVRQHRRKKHLMNRYGMTEDEYQGMYQEQEGKCIVCLQTFEILDVDHDHETGQIRGLLCNRHNRGLQLFNDSVEMLKAAAHYLER